MSSRQSALHRFFLAVWYGKSISNRFWVLVLLPISWLFIILSFIRCRLLSSRLLSGRTLSKQATTRLSVPVVVVGNISVGGVGKTPVVIALSQVMVAHKVKVGIISRGYGGNNTDQPLLVNEATDIHCSGDEAKLLAKEAQCPVVVCKNRVSAADYLIKLFPDIELLISDDGLQHYRLKRSMEIVVIDGRRGLGNGFCLPAGPLREMKRRLSTVDWVIVNEGHDRLDLNLPVNLNKIINVQLTPFEWQQVKTQQCFPLEPLPWQAGSCNVGQMNQQASKSIIAVAGIGNPDRFFDTLKALNITMKVVMFDDHHAFKREDFYSFENHIVLMTTKDAVKCFAFAEEQWWALGVKMQLPDKLIRSILSIIDK